MDPHSVQEPLKTPMLMKNQCSMTFRTFPIGKVSGPDEDKARMKIIEILKDLISAIYFPQSRNLLGRETMIFI